MKLSRELWLQVEPLVGAALEMQAEARAAWLSTLDATHADVAPVVRRMLEVHERAERNRELETVPRLATAPGWTSTHAPGAAIGPFELVRALGHGGMGEVWLARQADGRVERDVALKLPAIHQQANMWRERFQRERDILARLEHPNIARLYDAGVTQDGQPWLAMEFVAGPSLSEWLAAGSPSIAERLSLFRQMLGAVAHAHRHLVVHRDLKPANIVVDTSGQVRLLDFGIAKLLDEGDVPGGSDLTRLGGRVMTLRYAAPEQVAAGAITTATDVYALGVILHEMLTGLSPYRAVREGKALTDLMLLEEHEQLPSRLALEKPVTRELAGDLDAIVLKAMRRDPAGRYASVELFDEDIRAHLERRPVKARAGTWRYLAGRFAVRHRLPLATAAAVIVTLVGGLVMAERERRVAVAEKARAERHFASVRKLANSFIFDVQARIQSLPGSLAAQEMMVARSLEYLDALANEPGRDPALLVEVASAYRAIANIQGAPRAANRGNLAASIANFEKSRALLAELERLQPGDIAGVRERWKTSYALANAYFQVTDPRWQAEFRQAIELAERIATTPAASYEDRGLAALARGRQAHLVNISTGRTPRTEAVLVEAIRDLEGLRREAPLEAATRESLVFLYGHAGVMLAGPGEGPRRMPEAISSFEKALALARELHAEAPGDTRRNALERGAVLNLARWLAADGELRRAGDLMAEATALDQEMVTRYPDDVTMAVNRLMTLVGAADIANRLHDHPRAIRLSREVLAVAATLPKETARLRDSRMQVAEAKVILGYALLGTAEAGTLDREPRRALLMEVGSLFGDVSRFLEDVRAEPSLGAVPEYKLREFAQARARLQQALGKLAAS